MLVPAILYKDEIIKGMQKYFYTNDMMFETGCMENWTPHIFDCPNESQFQYAIIDKSEKLIGYLGYSVDWYTSKVYNFGLFSFDRGNILVGRDVFNKLEELIKTFHRVEWRAVGGNSACRGYDSFIKSHGGNKHILKDAIKDKDGNYHDDIIYEIVKQETETVNLNEGCVEE